MPHDSVKVVGEERTFRVRVGHYRVLYEVNWNEKIILISKIDKRPRVYWSINQESKASDRFLNLMYILEYIGDRRENGSRGFSEKLWFIFKRR